MNSKIVTFLFLLACLPADRSKLRYFICGPIPMIAAVEKDLIDLGIPLEKIHTENYEMA